MATRMSKTLRSAPVIEAVVVLTLKAMPTNVSREDLEQATIYVEQILNENVAEIVQGASACADFEHESIEIDMILRGDSPAALHQQLASVIGTLEEHRTLDFRDSHGNQFVLTSSTTHVAQSHSVAA
jgi:hypothetical protein